MPEANDSSRSSEPSDPFAPHMPEVDVLPDMTSFFANVRAKVTLGWPDKDLENGQRCVGIVTPGRMVTCVPAPKLNSVANEYVIQAKNLIPSEKPLNITVIAYTKLEAFHKDKAKCIPLLGQLLGMAYIGHNVIVFEGHESAFEAALRDADVFLIDLGMMPSLPSNWLDIVHRSMGPKPRIFVRDRKTQRLQPVVKSKNASGWRYTEPDGEASYANCLLTMLAKSSPVSVRVAAGELLPELTKLATDPQQIEWAEELLFRYDVLNAAKVIGIIHRFAKWAPAQGSQATGRLETKLATGGGQLQKVAFHLLLAKDSHGKYQLTIEKSAQV